ncbi:MAG TPA: hypothetical protein DEQ47_12275 [Solibacterales bacterium]|nr:hypothetical protein [Bryobacterales bacterium]
MDRIGRYKINKELGRGAMGVVYLATDPTIGRKVAIKTIKLREIDDAAERSRQRERLFREARSAGMLSHPHIVTIYDMGEEDGVAFIAMEYVHGQTLERVLGQGPALAPQRIFGILRQTAAALDFAHRKGIVHRDVKPANLMLDDAGQAKIADFGIAKITANESHTKTGTIVGTPNYMSPEQVRGETITGRSDQFSLGVIGYEILTGERPFTGEHLTTVVYKIVAEEPAPPQRINPTLGAAIDAVLRKALSKKPDARYPDCGAFIEALERACAATQGWRALKPGASQALPTTMESAPPLPSASARRTRPKTKTAKPAVAEAPPPRKRRRTFPIVAVCAMLVGALALLRWQMEQSGIVRPTTAAVPEPRTLPAAGPRPSPMPPPIDSSMPAPADESRPTDESAPKPGGKLQDVWVATNPQGATATLDASAENACTTPCMLHAYAGTHRLAVTMVEMGPEQRQIRVGDAALDVPLITLHRQMSTLTLTSTPSPADVYIDGKKQGQQTPAQLTLTPGNHAIAVQKDGQRASKTVELHSGESTAMTLAIAK